jgi:hypothetical protein
MHDSEGVLLEYSYNTSLAYDAINFGERYPDADERLEAIMKNIIKNRGTFKPPIS